MHVLCGKICKMVLYTELFYAIIPACFHTFCCSVIPTSPYILNVFYTCSIYMIVMLFILFSFTEPNLCNTSHWLQEQLANINLEVVDKNEQEGTLRGP